ncbi:hypothetical protein GCM10020258_07330 [Sphingomonas yabuuchiae]
MISGAICCIIGAWAPRTTSVSTPFCFSPCGKRIDSGALAVDRRGPTISGQRLTIALWTKPKRRKAAPPMAGSSSDTARGRLERGRLLGARTRLLISVPMP